jgi:hypothetical protein
LSNSRYTFFILTALALVVSAIPVIHYPFGWYETFFHEFSHGLAALASGGSLHRIELNFNGSGLCTTSGGNKFLILFAGYTGSGLWGVLVYFSASLGKKRLSKPISALLSITIVLVALLWAKDVATILILIGMMGLFLLSYRYSSRKFTQLFISFVAIYVVLNAIRSPLNLLDGKRIGDGYALSQLTMIPEFVWIGIWFLISCGCLYLMFKKSPIKV